MKKVSLVLLLVLALLPLLSHCASYDEVERLQSQLRTAQRRLEDMKSNQVNTIQREQAASSEQVSQLEQQTRSLQNQLDEANQLNFRLKEQNKSLEASVAARTQQDFGRRDEAIGKMEASLHAKDEKIAALEEKLRVQQENLKLMQTKRVGDTEKALKEAQAKADAARTKAKVLSTSTAGSSSGDGEIKKIVTGQTKIISAPTPVATGPKSTTTAASDERQPAVADDDPFDKIPTAPPAATASITAGGKAAPAPVKAAGNDKLAEGKQLYAQKQYAKAQAAFEAYLATKPSANQAAEADYMIGECNYRSKQYEQAIISYQKVASKPTLPKAAAATLKQGMAFEQLADVETAKTIYKKLIDKYPDSPEAKTAQERLGKL